MTVRTGDARLSEQLGWMRDGEAFLADHLASASLQHSSLLPGWTRAHVAAHLNGNAPGLLNLLHWARTGEHTPMYPNAEARTRDIDEWSQLSDEQLKAMVHDSAHALDAAASELPSPAWTAIVRTGMGRQIPASEVVWLRTRETWIHTIDLGTGAAFDALPAPLIDALLTDISDTLTNRPACPAATLAPEDRARTWTIGPTDADPVTVRGTASELLAYIAGRAHPRFAMTEHRDPPPIPAWL
jgi:maleylpyruvate isomerase